MGVFWIFVKSIELSSNRRSELQILDAVDKSKLPKLPGLLSSSTLSTNPSCRGFSELQILETVGKSELPRLLGPQILEIAEKSQVGNRRSSARRSPARWSGVSDVFSLVFFNTDVGGRGSLARRSLARTSEVGNRRSLVRRSEVGHASEMGGFSPPSSV